MFTLYLVLTNGTAHVINDYPTLADAEAVGMSLMTNQHVARFEIKHGEEWV